MKILSIFAALKKLNLKFWVNGICHVWSIGNWIYGHAGKFEVKNFEYLCQELIKILIFNEGQFYKNKPTMAWFLKIQVSNYIRIKF